MAKQEANVARDVVAELLGTAKPSKAAARLPSVKDVVESANGKASKPKVSAATKASRKAAGKPVKGKAASGATPASAKTAKGKGKPAKAAGSEPAKGKAAKPGKPVGRPSPYTDDQKIVVVKAREGRGQMQKLWEMVAKSKTIGSYKLAREKAGLEGLGGVFSSFVKDGNIKVK